MDILIWIITLILAFLIGNTVGYKWAVFIIAYRCKEDPELMQAFKNSFMQFNIKRRQEDDK